MLFYNLENDEWGPVWWYPVGERVAAGVPDDVRLRDDHLQAVGLGLGRGQMHWAADRLRRLQRQVLAVHTTSKLLKTATCCA